MRQGSSFQLAQRYFQKTWKEKARESFIRRSWWMFLFLALCYLLYSHGIQKKQYVLDELRLRFKQMEQEKMLAMEVQGDLLLQIQSQSDPAWIQMVLMKGLGVVPEGQRKVYFQNEEN